jgi:hypothetical protein
MQIVVFSPLKFLFREWSWAIRLSAATVVAECEVFRGKNDGAHYGAHANACLAE